MRAGGLDLARRSDYSALVTLETTGSRATVTRALRLAQGGATAAGVDPFLQAPLALGPRAGLDQHDGQPAPLGGSAEPVEHQCIGIALGHHPGCHGDIVGDGHLGEGTAWSRPEWGLGQGHGGESVGQAAGNDGDVGARHGHPPR
jgi:hypothetical protein